MSESLELSDLPSDRISVTRMEMFRRCPKQYEFRYIDGLKIPPAGNLIVGISAHKALEFDFAQKRVSGVNLPVNRVKEAASASFEGVVEDAKSKAGGVDWEGEDPGAEKDDMIRSVTQYHGGTAQAIQPTAVEQQFELKFKDTAFGLIGVIDLIRDSKEIIDFKTTKKYRKSIENEVENPMPFQLGVYNLAVPGIESVRLDYLIRGKKTGADNVTVAYPALKHEGKATVLWEIQTLSTAMRTGLFYPNPGFGMMNCSMCGYKAMCPVWKRKTILPVVPAPVSEGGPAASPAPLPVPPA